MAISSSYDVLYTRNEIITEALELIGVVEAGETPGTDDINSCARTLNMLVKFWQSRGIALWRDTQIYVFLQEDTASYTLGPTGTSPATTSFTKTEIATAGSSSDLTIDVDSIDDISASDIIGIELDDGPVDNGGRRALRYDDHRRRGAYRRHQCRRECLRIYLRHPAAAVHNGSAIASGQWIRDPDQDASPKRLHGAIYQIYFR